MRFKKTVLVPLPEEPRMGKMERLVMLVWLVPRILSIVALVAGIVFVVALLVTLGQAEGRMPIQEGLRTAAGFTVEYLAGLLHGDLGVVTPRYAAAAPTPVIEELGRTLPKSLGLLFMALDLDTGGGRYLLHHPIYPRQASDSWLVIEIEGVGPGDERLSSESLGGLGLSRILEESAGRIGAKVNYLGEAGFFFGEVADGYGFRADQAYSGLRITRLGDELSGGPLDTLDHLDPELLGEAGRVVDHLLMVLSAQG